MAKNKTTETPFMIAHSELLSIVKMYFIERKVVLSIVMSRTPF